MIIHTETDKGEGSGELVSARSLHVLFLVLSGMRGRVRPTAQNPPGHADLKHEQRTVERVSEERSSYGVTSTLEV